jgi:cytochrome c551
MLVLLLAIACSGSDPKGDATAGADVYAGTCAACHGADGTLGVETNGVAAADLPDEVNELSDAELTDVIQNGKGEMPAQPLDDTETADVIAYMHEQWG